MQVLGHTKTILVLLTSWVALKERMSDRKLLGMSMAVTGMIAYGYFSSKAGKTPSTAAGKEAADTMAVTNGPVTRRAVRGDEPRVEAQVKLRRSSVALASTPQQQNGGSTTLLQQRKH